MDYTCSDIAQMIDYALLKPELTEENIIQGCQLARKYNLAAVCCSPSMVPLVKKQLEGSGVKVTTVVGFPFGFNKTKSKVCEAETAIKDGAVELDMVLHIGKLLSQDFNYIKRDIQAVVETARRKQVAVKVILENYYLTDELIEIGCKLCEEAGADWVKTSTGLADGGATIEDLKLMRKAVSSKVQIKAAGGVRGLEMVVQAREIGCTRVGTSCPEKIMEQCYRKKGKPKS